MFLMNANCLDFNLASSVLPQQEQFGLGFIATNHSAG